MATELVTPDWAPTHAVCHACGAAWHALRRGDCETSCLAPEVIIPLLTWQGDDN